MAGERDAKGTVRMIDKLKGAWKSWVIWFNGLAAAVLALLPMLQDALPAIQQYVPDIRWAAVGIIVANIALRFKTKTALENK